MSVKSISLGIVAGFASIAASTAFAIPFKIQGSSLDATFGSGGALGSYFDNSMASAIDLGEGDSFEFNFGSVIVPIASGSGTVKFAVDLSTPTPDGPVVDEGSFWVKSFFLSFGDLSWGSPVLFNYSYGGVSGGQFQLDMYDFHGGFASVVDLKGRITNLTSPEGVVTSAVAVPEPGVLSLLGTGLLALAFVGRRRSKVNPT